MSKATRRGYSIPKEPDFTIGTSLENSEPLEMEDESHPTPAEVTAAAHDMIVGVPRESIGKVVVNDQTPRCPFCKSHLLMPIGSRNGANAFADMHCSNCQRDFKFSENRVSIIGKVS